MANSVAELVPFTASQVADWLRHQDPDSWWRVDGEPEIAGCVALPALAGDLAKWFEDQGTRPIFVALQDSTASRNSANRKELRDFETEWFGITPALQLAWSDDHEKLWDLVRDPDVEKWVDEMSTQPKE
ncbi:MAG: hypothetical protein KF777_04390 [Planctomycetaceae bacterium]|nr:hypothetical protein [Planctomycetaceae bacterium]